LYPINSLEQKIQWHHAANKLRHVNQGIMLVAGNVGPHLLADVAWPAVAALVMVPLALHLLKRILIK